MKTFDVTMVIKKEMEVAVAAETVEEAIAVATRLYLNHDLDHMHETVKSVFAYSENENENGLNETTTVVLHEDDDFEVKSVLRETSLDDETEELFNGDFFDEDIEEDDYENEKNKLKSKVLKALLEYRNISPYAREHERKEQNE